MRHGIEKVTTGQDFLERGDHLAPRPVMPKARFSFHDLWIVYHVPGFPRKLLQQAEMECPPPEPRPKNGKRGRTAKSKSRNLLERLQTFENDVLRFLDDPLAPFTNNQAENDLRMIKVQQKISGCFRSMEGAEAFCRIRSHITTCRKQGATASQALRLLFQSKWPDFMNEGDNPICAEWLHKI